MLIKPTLVLLNCLVLFFIHFNLELVTQFPTSTDELFDEYQSITNIFYAKIASVISNLTNILISFTKKPSENVNMNKKNLCEYIEYVVLHYISFCILMLMSLKLIINLSYP